jgi:methionyl aminopeptidase
MLSCSCHPCNLGYQPAWAATPFPSILCVNVNDEAVHTPARDRILEDGDLVNIDVGLRYRTACADAATTFVVGKATPSQLELLRVTKMALENAVQMVRPGISVGKIGNEIDRVAKRFGMNPIHGFAGHRIGEEMHLLPTIPHERNTAADQHKLEPGMVVCIEPMLTTGSGDLTGPTDHWSRSTIECYGLVAQFESMVLVTKDGHRTLTSHI